MLEAALNKSGPELFKELLRVYPVADLDDYWRAGLWKNDLMKTDLVLIESHRREAGAPDPIPLEEVQMPDLPIVAKLPGMFGFSANGVVPPKAASAVGAVTAAGGPVAELRLIALFVAKWKMDPTKTKLLLAKMTPARRRYVIQNFKTPATGTLDPSTALDHFIAQCEKSGDWDKAPVVVTPKPLVPGAVAPAKRPSIITPGILDPSKRPRVAATVAPPAGAPAAWAAKMAALRGQAPTTIPPNAMQTAKVISPLRPIAPKIAPKPAPKAWS